MAGWRSIIRLALGRFGGYQWYPPPSYFFYDPYRQATFIDPYRQATFIDPGSETVFRAERVSTFYAGGK